MSERAGQVEHSEDGEESSTSSSAASGSPKKRLLARTRDMPPPELGQSSFDETSDECYEPSERPQPQPQPQPQPVRLSLSLSLPLPKRETKADLRLEIAGLKALLEAADKRETDHRKRIEELSAKLGAAEFELRTLKQRTAPCEFCSRF